MRMEFWSIWARIAIAEADRSASARGRFGASEDSSDGSRALDDELNSGLVAVCAVAFSLEALILLLTPIVMQDATAQAWTAGNRRKFVGRLREILKHFLALSGSPSGLSFPFFLGMYFRWAGENR